jgi:hypothetical protein
MTLGNTDSADAGSYPATHHPPPHHSHCTACVFHCHPFWNQHCQARPDVKSRRENCFRARVDTAATHTHLPPLHFLTPTLLACHCAFTPRPPARLLNSLRANASVTVRFSFTGRVGTPHWCSATAVRLRLDESALNETSPHRQCACASLTVRVHLTDSTLTHHHEYKYMLSPH